MFNVRVFYLTRHMKMAKDKVSFSIWLAVFQARGGARVKLHTVGTANRRISNIEPQNYEGWNCCALSFELIKIDRIPSFDIRYSIFSFL
jgi:hypothetical protein